MLGHDIGPYNRHGNRHDHRHDIGHNTGRKNGHDNGLDHPGYFFHPPPRHEYAGPFVHSIVMQQSGPGMQPPSAAQSKQSFCPFASATLSHPVSAPATSNNTAATTNFVFIVTPHA